ncbi:ABC transporter ATP-binding protein [Exiguobacterium sp. s143]|uniref:ABC transporter ATP-binding protein n=1 Tax=Exiguobacterium sp. s143 TaxID=2751201 RepID=UPI002036C605|nr:ABC transporter ATP-binding protein [Exiguobacterium sp. s143]
MITVDDLSIRYPGQMKSVLNHVSLSIEQGTTLLLGRSGSGKTTLLHALAGLTPETIEVEQTGTVTRSGSVGVLFQNPEEQFCMETIGREIAFSLENRSIPRAEMEGRIEHLLTLVGLPLPFSTPIASLSGGMKQRLALAAVLALEPTILLLDEPTAQIDPIGQHELMALIFRIQKEHDLKIVLIEHQLDVCLPYVDQIILLEDGSVTATAHPQDLFPQAYTELQSKGIAVPSLYPYTLETLPIDGPQAARLHVLPPVATAGTALLHVAALSTKAPYSLTDATFSLKTGEWVMLLGANGSGKSTLLATLGRLLSHQGTYRFQERPAQRYSRRRFYEHVGYVFQQPDLQFLKLTVEAEIDWSHRAATSDERTALLERLELASVKQQSPLALSTGQQRRLSVATMLGQSKDVLLLDEPTFGQDGLTTRRLMEQLLTEQQNGTTLVMATHDMELVARYADRVLVMEQGRIAFDGRPSELFADVPLLERCQLQRPLSYQFQEVKRHADKRVTVR